MHLVYKLWTTWHQGTTNLVTILHFFSSAADKHTLPILGFDIPTVLAVRDMKDQAATVSNIRDY